MYLNTQKEQGLGMLSHYSGGPVTLEQRAFLRLHVLEASVGARRLVPTATVKPERCPSLSTESRTFPGGFHSRGGS